MKLRIVITLMLVPTSQVAFAYEPANHRQLTSAATAISILGDRSLAERRKVLGLSDQRRKYVNTKGNKERSIVDLVEDGAWDEDDSHRGLNHFFNPRTGAGLTLVEGQLPGLTTADSIAIRTGGSSSPDWALGTYGSVHYPVQRHSYKDLKNYYMLSLTGASPSTRSSATVLAFETLGHIVHHLQDMAQPQHVRNDAHLQDDQMDIDCERQYSPILNPLDYALCYAYRRATNPSFYEKWTRQLTNEYGRTLPLAGYPAVFAPSAATNANFSDPRKFWTNAGRGMSDFTNVNFFSAGSMELRPPEPQAKLTIATGALCADANPPCGNIDLTLAVHFRPTKVDDALMTTSGLHPYAYSWSIFTPDFNTYAISPEPTTVNRFTFEYNYAYLLPRAVGYSAGFINYFFRGDIEIAPPDDGVFAVADLRACGVPCGFRVLKLKLKNATPNEAIGAGKLRLVAKYHVNNCFATDLSGEDGGPAFNGATCRNPEEEVVVSDELDVSSVSTSFGSDLIFPINSKTPIPMGASDLRLQVVFRGKLGQEDDAIVASTLDLAEPNYIGVGNFSDYFFSETNNRYVKLLDSETPTALTNVSFGFRNLNTSPPLATLSSLKGGEHAQLAVLTTKSPSKLWLRMTSPTASAFFDDTPFAPEEFYQDEEIENAPYARSCQVRLERGQYRQFSAYYIERRHGVIPNAPLTSAEAALPSHNNLAKYRSDCAGVPEPGSGGIYDLSPMQVPLSASTAKSWTINFP